MPRILGYVFNPLSVYFCYRRDGALAAILYEVHNTFGERHSYLIPVDAAHRGALRQRCDKRFYVSPFIGHGHALRLPRRAAAASACASRSGAATPAGPVLIAALAGAARARSPTAALLRGASSPIRC